MIKLSAYPYYVKTLASLILHTSWWRIPLLLRQRPILFSVPLGLRFYVSNLMDIWTLQEVIVDQHYERCFQIPRDGKVIDIGGSIGDFSIFAEKVRRAKKVHSYELNPERISLYKKNVQLNQAKRLTLHEKPALSLDQVFKETKLESCDFMKVDCEGGEYDIFAQAQTGLLKKIKRISFEVHWFTQDMKSAYPTLKDTLRKAGFRLVEHSNPVHDTIGFLYAIQT